MSTGTQYKRKFNKKYYHKHDWLCGCQDTRSLFCFPCLLFGGDDLWTIVGFRNISKISTTCQKHEQSDIHIKNMVSFSLMGQNSKWDRWSNCTKTLLPEVSSWRQIFKYLKAFSSQKCYKFVVNFTLMVQAHFCLLSWAKLW